MKDDIVINYKLVTHLFAAAEDTTRVYFVGGTYVDVEESIDTVEDRL